MEAIAYLTRIAIPLSKYKLGARVLAQTLRETLKTWWWGYDTVGRRAMGEKDREVHDADGIEQAKGPVA